MSENPGKGADEGDGEPVARRLNLANLRANILRQMRKRVALAQAAFRSNVFVAASKRNRLEADKRDFLGVFHRELHHRANLIVVHVVDDGNDQHDFNAGFVHVLDGAQLHVKEVADLAMPVGVVTDTVELQVRVTHARLKRLLAELFALREFDAVGSSLHAVVANLASVRHRLQKVRAHGRFAAAELHGHLSARLDFQSIVENFLNFVPAQLMHVTNLVSVHETRIAHHVAAIGEVHGKHRAAAITHRAGAVLVQILVIVRGNIATGILLLNPAQPLGIDGHHVFVVAVLWAVFHHPDLAIALDDLRLDLANLLAHQIAPILFTSDDGFARFLHAGGTERIGLPWEPERGLGLLPGFEQRLIRPLRSYGRVRIALVEMLDRVEGDPGSFAQDPIHRSENLRCDSIRHKLPPSTFQLLLGIQPIQSFELLRAIAPGLKKY